MNTQAFSRRLTLTELDSIMRGNWHELPVGAYYLIGTSPFALPYRNSQTIMIPLQRVRGRGVRAVRRKIVFVEFAAQLAP